MEQIHQSRLLYRWLYHHHNNIEHEKYQTLEFIKIKNKKNKRIFSYLESEIWKRDELLPII